MSVKKPDPLLPLIQEFEFRDLIDDNHNPVIWKVDDEWVTQTGHDSWTIGADEPATADQVRDLIEKSNGNYKLQN